MYEDICEREGCSRHGVIVEHYSSTANSDPVHCEECASPMLRMFSLFASPLMGPISARYNDKNLENAHQEGHWAWTRKTPDGKPRAEFITTFAEQRDFCKREGLVNPSSYDVPTNVEAGPDGKTVSSVGLKGQWGSGMRNPFADDREKWVDPKYLSETGQPKEETAA